MRTRQTRSEHARAKTMRRELEERVAQLKALSRSQAIISTSTTVQEVLQGVLGEQMRVLSADTAIIVLREGDTSHFRVAAVSGYGGREPEMLQVRTSFEENPILYQMSRTHTGLVIDDAQREPRLQNLGGSTDVERSLLIAPLVFKDVFLGVTAVSRTSPNVYTAENLELLTLFAHQAAVAIANAQLHEAVQRQRDELARRQTTHETLIALVLDGGTIADIASAFAEQSGLVVEIQGMRGEQLARAVPSNATPEPCDQKLCIPITAQRQRLASVCLYGQSHAFTSSMQALAEQAGVVVALTLMREQAAYEAERRVQSELVEHLLADSMTEGSRFWVLAERLGWKAGSAAQVCIAVAEPAQTAGMSASVHDMKERFAQATSTWLRCHLPCALHALRNNEIVMLLPASADLDTTMQKLLDYLTDELPSIMVTIGIGEQRSLMFDLHTSYESAQQALQLARQLDRRGEVLTVDTFGLLALLVRATGRRELEHFAIQTLGPILSSPDLLSTLRLYLATNGSLVCTAQRLFTHRNTVLYRLKQVEERLGLSLSDGDTRLRLDLALKILDTIRPTQHDAQPLEANKSAPEPVILRQASPAIGKPPRSDQISSRRSLAIHCVDAPMPSE